MASSELQIIISAVNQTREALNSVIQDTRAISKALDDLSPKDTTAQFKKTTDEVTKTREAVQGLQTSMVGLERLGSSIAQAFSFLTRGILAYGAISFAKSLADVAARTEVLGTVLAVVGKNAGYTQKELNKTEKEVMKLGITTQSARNSLIQMSQAGIDIVNAGPLARAAQDLAVVSGWNSSQTFQRLIINIQQLDTLGLRWMGLVLNKEKIWADYQIKYGKAVEENNRRQVFADAVLKESTKLAGTYAMAMENVGKSITSLPRLKETLQEKLGAAFLPVYAVIIKQVTVALENMVAQVDEAGKLKSPFTWAERLELYIIKIREFVEELFRYREAIMYVVGAYTGFLIVANLITIFTRLWQSIQLVGAGLVWLAGKFTFLGTLKAALLVAGKTIVAGLAVIFTSLPVLAIAAVAAAIIGVAYAIKNWDAVKEMIAKYPAIKKFTDGVVAIFKTAWSYVVEGWEHLWNMVGYVMDRVVVIPLERFFAKIYRQLASFIRHVPRIFGGGEDRAKEFEDRAKAYDADADSRSSEEFWERRQKIIDTANAERESLRLLTEQTFAWGDAQDSVTQKSPFPEDSLELVAAYIRAQDQQKQLFESQVDSQRELAAARKNLREELQREGGPRLEILGILEDEEQKHEQAIALQDKQIKSANEWVLKFKAVIEQRKDALSDEAKLLLESYENVSAAEKARIVQLQKDGEAFQAALRDLGLSTEQFGKGVDEKFSKAEEAFTTMLAKLPKDTQLALPSVWAIIDAFQKLTNSVHNTAEGIKTEAIGASLIGMLKAFAEGGQLTPEAIAQMDAVINAVELGRRYAKTKGEQGQRDIEGGGAARIAADKAFADAQRAAREAAVRRENELEKTQTGIFLDQLKERYDRGQVTTEEYYSERLKASKKSFDADERLRAQQEANIRSKRPANAAEAEKRRADLADIVAKKELLNLQREADLQKITVELVKDKLAKADRLVDLQIEVRKYTDEEKAAQDALNAKYDRQLRDATESARIEIEKLRTLERQDLLYQQSQRRQQGLLTLQQSALAAAQTELDVLRNKGDLTTIEYSKANNVLIEARVKLLREQQSLDIQNLARLRSMGTSEGSAEILGLREKIAQFDNQINQLENSVSKLGETFQKTFGNQVTSFLDAVLLKTKKFGDALKDSIRGFAESVLKVITVDWGEQVARKVSKIGADKEGEGGPFERLANLLFPQKGEDLIEKSLKKPLSVYVTNFVDRYGSAASTDFDSWNFDFKPFEGKLNVVLDETADLLAQFARGGGGGVKGGLIGLAIRGILGLASGPSVAAQYDMMTYMSEGGPITGKGTGTSDSNLAWVSNGEFVVKAKQAKKWLPVLDAINSGKPIANKLFLQLASQMPRFAAGGLVELPELPTMSGSSKVAGGIPMMVRGGDNVSVTINSDLTNSSGGMPPKENLSKFGQAIGSMVQEEIVKQKRPGGLLYG